MFQLHTLDGRWRATTWSGTCASAASAVPIRNRHFPGVKDGAYGFAAMTSKNPQLAFMQGIQNKDIQIQGNPALVIWFRVW